MVPRNGFLEHCVAGTSAQRAINVRASIARPYPCIIAICAKSSHNRLLMPSFSGEIEVGESYFGEHRKGKRGRGTAGKVSIFGLLKRCARVHAVMIPNAGHQTLMSISQLKVQPDSIAYSDSWHAYDKQAKRRLRRYNRIPLKDFHLFLAECKWRFNTRSPTTLVKILTRWANFIP